MEKSKTHNCCAASRPVMEQDQSNKSEEMPVGRRQAVSLRGMVEVTGNEFLMGTNDREGFLSDREGPVRKVNVDSFYIDATTVTNEDFAKFVEQTGYSTDAEKYGWSFVFYQHLSEQTSRKVEHTVQGSPWWWVVEGAYWYQPNGPDASIENIMDHPVVHVSWNDAIAYCKWSGKRLPTEAEWEYAARGGYEQKKYPWGNNLQPGGKHYCNIWQGDFPKHNTREDGYFATAPAKAFPANGFGLYNVSGNVWEWCGDCFDRQAQGGNRVMRGGSYLCHESYCNRYRVAARTSNTPDSSTGNIGFRCVADA